jgi:alkylation response protein AidB-like acyl-CoA dehydrogenase
VDFGLNEQQEMMQTLARDVLAAEYTDKVLKAAVKDERGYTPELWKKLAETNLTGLSLPEQYGGVGDFLDLTVVLEEMGRVCFLSPYFSTVVLGASAIMAAGSDVQQHQYLTDIAAGKIIMTLALTETKADYSPADVLAKAEVQGTGFVLNGTKLFVPDAQSADYIIIAARTKLGLKPEDGITLFIIDAKTEGLHIVPLKTAAGDKQSEVILRNVYVLPENILGPVDGGWPLIEKILQRANIARCAQMVGLAQQALKMTLDYAKERIAFGHPIGAFQAIQHRCADMLIDIEGSRFATYQAAWRLNEGLEAAKEVAVAKAWVSQACKRVMASAHQVHGAIGFTEDHVLHYYTKRSRAYEFSFGGADAQLEKLAELYWK